MGNMTGVNLTTEAAVTMAEKAIMNSKLVREECLAIIDKEELEYYAALPWWHVFFGCSTHIMEEEFEKRRKYIKRRSAKKFQLAESIIVSAEHSASPYLYMSAEDVAALVIYSKEW